MRIKKVFSVFLNRVFTFTTIYQGYFANKKIVNVLDDIVPYTHENNVKLNRLLGITKQVINLPLFTAESDLDFELTLQIEEGLDLIEQLMLENSPLKIKSLIPENIASIIDDKFLSLFIPINRTIQSIYDKAARGVFAAKHLRLIDIADILGSNTQTELVENIMRISPNALEIFMKNYPDFYKNLESNAFVMPDFSLKQPVTEEPMSKSEEQFSELFLAPSPEVFSRAVNTKPQSKKRKQRENAELEHDDANKIPRRSARLANLAKK